MSAEDICNSLILSDEFSCTTNQQKSNRRHLVVWSTKSTDCIKIQKKAHSTDTVHVNCTFSHCYVHLTIREKGVNMNSLWFTEDILPEIAQLIADNKFGVSIDLLKFQHDNCRSFTARSTKRFIDEYFPAEVHKIPP